MQSGGVAGAAPARARPRPRAPGLLLRLSPRGVPRASACCPAPEVFDRAVSRVLGSRRGGRVSVASSPAGGRAAGLLAAALLDAVGAELGHRRVRRPARPRALDARRGTARPAGAAAERDGAGPGVAVLGRQRDGPRSDLHLACRMFPTSRRLGGEDALDTRRCAACSTTRAQPRGGLLERPDAQGPGAAAAFRRFVEHEWGPGSDRARQLKVIHRASRPGGSTTTRCSGRRSTSPTAGRGREWPAACAIDERTALSRFRRELGAGHPLPAVPAVDRARHSGGRRAEQSPGVACLGRLPVRRGRRQRRRVGEPATCSRSTAPSARRPTRSARTARTGQLPVYRWDAMRDARLRVVRRPSPARVGPLRRLPRRSRRRALPDVDRSRIDGSPPALRASPASPRRSPRARPFCRS